MKIFLKKHWFNILFVFFLFILFFNPLGIGTTIKSSIIRTISFGPSVIEEKDRVFLSNYNWQLQDLEGNYVDFNSQKSKVIFISFWATWCPPCVAEMPSIQDLYNKYGDKLEFMLISDESPAKINGFKDKNGYNFPIYSNVSSPLTEFESSSIPTSFLIDKNGGIVIKKKGAANWNSISTKGIIDELLNEN
jgi:thiol-disulfide isomerase/thioredoxin